MKGEPNDYLGACYRIVVDPKIVVEAEGMR